MSGFTYLVLLSCFACAAAVVLLEEGRLASAPDSEDVAHRELTDNGYVIKHNGVVFRYPFGVSAVVPRYQPPEKKPLETNVIEEEDTRPLFYFTPYEASESSRQRRLPNSRPFIEIRKKRDVGSAEVPESSKVGKLRRKRTYCHKCGGGGYGGRGYTVSYVPVSYVPVSYVAYPAYPSYYGGGGGRGKGCYSCGGGGGYGGGGYGGGSYSYSSSSAQSSAGSFGWGK